jgi:hypothetical protein
MTGNDKEFPLKDIGTLELIFLFFQDIIVNNSDAGHQY